jgi:hypothetical protein
MGSGNATLYAQWNGDTQTVTYFPNHDFLGTSTHQSVTTGQQATLLLHPFTRTGYTFAGWNTQPNGAGISYAGGASMLVGPSGVDLYAVWVGNPMTVNFDANGGQGSMPSVTSTVDSELSLPSNTYTNPGMVFAGWRTADMASRSVIEDRGMIVTGVTDISLFAVWIPTELGYFRVSSRLCLSSVPASTSGTFVVPEGIADLTSSAFTGCTGITVLSLPASFMMTSTPLSYSISPLINLTALMVDPANTYFSADTQGALLTKDQSRIVSIPPKMTSYTIPNTVGAVYPQELANADGLRSLFIPPSVAYFDSASTNGTFNFTTFIVDPNNSYYSSDSSGVLYDKTQSTLIKAPQRLAGSYTVAPTTTTIAEGAFNNCAIAALDLPPGLTSIATYGISSCEIASLTIPASLTNLDQDAINGNSQLSAVTMLASSPPTFGTGNFANCAASLLIHVPAGSLAAYQNAPGWSVLASRIVSP